MLTLDQIVPYLRLNSDSVPEVRHAFYDRSVEHAREIAQVFGKTYPDYLNINRPKESAESKEYRARVYRNPMRSLRGKTLRALEYIRMADDFDIVFPESDLPDSLKGYVESQAFSRKGKFLDWFFEKVRKAYVDDPNAVFCVLPLVQPASDTEYTKPKPMLIPSERVYQHREGTFAVLEAPEKSKIEENGSVRQGKTLIFLDQESYCIARQLRVTKGPDVDYADWLIDGLRRNDDGSAASFSPPLHYCGIMPAVKIGQECVEENDEGETYYESVLAHAFEPVKECQAVESDIQVERNFHVSSQEWRYMTKQTPCRAGCEKGRILGRDYSGKIIDSGTCATCRGTGYETSSGSGLEMIVVTPPSATGFADENRPASIPTPPGGFIPRPVEAIQEMRKDAERYSREAYAVVNMQFMRETPVEQSGTAKRYDREEMYRELNTIGGHICRLLQNGLHWTGYQRYRTAAIDQLPTVIEPVRFNLENAELTREELTQAKHENFDPNIQAPLTKRLIEYQAGKDSDYYRKFELKEQLDPYQGMRPDEKIFLLSSMYMLLRGNPEALKISAESVWLSINFDALVTELMRTNPDFLMLDRQLQFTMMVEANKKRVGTPTEQLIDPQTGLPFKGPVVIQPPVNFKNNGQV